VVESKSFSAAGSRFHAREVATERPAITNLSSLYDKVADAGQSQRWPGRSSGLLTDILCITFRFRDDLLCDEWVVKPYTQLNSTQLNCHSLVLSLLDGRRSLAIAQRAQISGH